MRRQFYGIADAAGTSLESAGGIIDHKVITHSNFETVNAARNQTEVLPRNG